MSDQTKDPHLFTSHTYHFHSQQLPIMSEVAHDERSPQEIKQDKQLAERLSSLIEDANQRVIPLCKQIRVVSIMALSSFKRGG